MPVFGAGMTCYLNNNGNIRAKLGYYTIESVMVKVNLKFLTLLKNNPHLNINGGKGYLLIFLKKAKLNHHLLKSAYALRDRRMSAE